MEWPIAFLILGFLILGAVIALVSVFIGAGLSEHSRDHVLNQYNIPNNQMADSDARRIERAIEDNTREIKNLTRAIERGFKLLKPKFEVKQNIEE